MGHLCLNPRHLLSQPIAKFTYVRIQASTVAHNCCQYVQFCRRFLWGGCLIKALGAVSFCNVGIMSGTFGTSGEFLFRYSYGMKAEVAVLALYVSCYAIVHRRSICWNRTRAVCRRRVWQCLWTLNSWTKGWMFFRVLLKFNCRCGFDKQQYDDGFTHCCRPQFMACFKSIKWSLIDYECCQVLMFLLTQRRIHCFVIESQGSSRSASAW